MVTIITVLAKSSPSGRGRNATSARLNDWRSWERRPQEVRIIATSSYTFIEASPGRTAPKRSAFSATISRMIAISENGW